MSYNRKIIRTSSYLEIWEYESPIFSNDTTQIDEEHISLKKRRNVELLKNSQLLNKMNE